MMVVVKLEGANDFISKNVYKSMIDKHVQNMINLDNQMV